VQNINDHSEENLLGTTKNIELLFGENHDAFWDLVTAGWQEGSGDGLKTK